MRTTSAYCFHFLCICCHLIYLQHPALPCKTRYSAPPVNGRRCISNYEANTIAAKSYGYCVWKCLSQEKCHYVNYNTENGNCSLGNKMCGTLATAPDFRMILFYPKREECTQWVPYTVNPYPVGLVTMQPEVLEQIVARVQYQSHVLPGKVHPYYHNSFWTSLGAERVSHFHVQNVAAVEVLTIDMSCLQFWVAIETGSSLPDDAFVAGHLNDGTPLYTARFLAGSVHCFGYYNPKTNMAHGEEIIVQVSTTFDILVVLEPRRQ